MNSLDHTIIKKRIQLEQQFFPNGMTADMIQLLDTVGTMLKAAYLVGIQEGQADQAWSNQSCLGYIISAAERTGMKESATHSLIRSMHRSFDELTLEEAASHYRQSPY